MSENTTPSIYSQPDADADDVLGHSVRADKTADSVRSAHDEDDVEGHSVRADSVRADKAR